MCGERAAGVTTVKLVRMAMCLPVAETTWLPSTALLLTMGACIPCPSLPMAPPSNSFWTVSRVPKSLSHSRRSASSLVLLPEPMTIRPTPRGTTCKSKLSPNRAMLSSPMTFPVTPLIPIGLLSTHLSLKEALAISMQRQGMESCALWGPPPSNGGRVVLCEWFLPLLLPNRKPLPCPLIAWLRLVREQPRGVHYGSWMKPKPITFSLPMCEGKVAGATIARSGKMATCPPAVGTTWPSLMVMLLMTEACIPCPWSQMVKPSNFCWMASKVPRFNSPSHLSSFNLVPMRVPMMTPQIPLGTTWSLSLKAEPPSTPVRLA